MDFHDTNYSVYAWDGESIGEVDRETGQYWPGLVDVAMDGGWIPSQVYEFYLVEGQMAGDEWDGFKAGLRAWMETADDQNAEDQKWRDIAARFLETHRDHEIHISMPCRGIQERFEAAALAMEADILTREADLARRKDSLKEVKSDVEQGVI